MKYVLNTRTVNPQTVIITCQGEMDTLAVQELRQAVEPLLADSASHLIFDLAAVEYVSSSVLSFLMVIQGKAQEKSGKVSLVWASDLVRQVFEMASLDSLFDFHPKLEDLGIALQAPAVPAKGKTPRREKGTPAKEAKPVVNAVEGAATPQEARSPEKSQVAPVSRQERRGAGEVEKIHPVTERRSWKDYGAWIGIAVVASVSLLVSLYFYVTR